VKVAIAHPDRATVSRLQTLLAEQPGIRVAWTADTAQRLLATCAVRTPDLLLMGLDFPGLAAGELTRRLMTASPCSILLLNQGCDPCFGRVFEALGQGAADAAVLPPAHSWNRPESWADLLNRLDTLRTLAGHGRKVPAARSPADAAPPRLRLPPVIAIGASTGGPRALAAVISSLPRELPATVVIVQHLDFHFTEGLAEWLNLSAALPVAALTGETRLEPGRIWVAARPEHLIVTDALTLGWTDAWPDLTIRPSIDVFFKSLAAHAPLRGGGILLTGMGRDGAEGLLALRRAGFFTVAQDEASSVVYGMPKAAAQLGAAETILPLDAIAGHIVRHVARLNAA